MTAYPLADWFPPATEAEWRARAAAGLKGEAIDSRLVRHTREGILLEMLYGAGDAAALDAPRSGRWALFQRADHPDPARANAQALEDLAGGADGLTLCIDGCITARGHGIPIAGMDLALKDVALHEVALRIDAGPDGLAAAETLAALIRRSPVNPQLMSVSFGLNPLGVLARRASAARPWAAAAADAAAFAEEMSGEFAGPFAAATGRVWHEWGASEAQELGLTLAAAAAYLRLFEGALNEERLPAAVSVTLAAGSVVMDTIAKFRAMRLLWSRVLAAAGLPGAALDLHAETSFPMMAARDPHTNILRTAAATSGAALGGATSICVLPFSIAQGLPNAFARRVARQQQLVLLEEANLWRVDDPGAGAGLIERMTSEFAHTAWSVFQMIEAAGGLAMALTDGTVKALIARNPEPPFTPQIGVTLHPLPEEYAAAVETPMQQGSGG